MSNFANQSRKNVQEQENVRQAIRMRVPILQDKFPTTGTPANRPLHSCTNGGSHSPKKRFMEGTDPQPTVLLVPAPIIPRHTLGMCLTTSHPNMGEFYDPSSVLSTTYTLYP